MRAWLAALLLTLAVPDLATGLRQVREGDFEGAVVTLEAVVASLGPSGPAKELAQAHLYLGIAQLALDRRDEAKARFRDALAYDPELRLSPAAFSPKVLGLFEEVRQERQRTAAGPAGGKRGGGSKAALVIGGAAAAGAGIALAVRGGQTQNPPGTTALSNARFGTPVVVCPDGSQGVLLPVTVLADLDNGGDTPLVIGSVSVTLIITASTFPEEINFASSLPVRLSADRVGPRSRGALTLSTDLVCGNGSGDAGRFNEWRANLTLTTSAGVFNAETSDRLRVNIP